jgi:hypothetical protein
VQRVEAYYGTYPQPLEPPEVFSPAMAPHVAGSSTLKRKVPARLDQSIESNRTITPDASTRPVKLRKSPRLQKKQMENEVSEMRLPSYPGSTDNPGRMKELIVKDSFPLSERNNEGDVFQGHGELFGLPVVINSFVVVDQGGPQKWHRIQSLNPLGTALDRRDHVRSLISTVGLPLTTADTPCTLVRGVLHAFLGMFTLHLQRHMLILILRQAIGIYSRKAGSIVM